MENYQKREQYFVKSFIGKCSLRGLQYLKINCIIITVGKSGAKIKLFSLKIINAILKWREKTCHIPHIWENISYSTDNPSEEGGIRRSARKGG